MGSQPTGSIPKSMCIFCFLVPCHCHHCLDKGKINPYPKLHFTAHEKFFKKTLLWCCIFKHFYEECVLSSFLPRKGRYYCAPFKQVKRPRPQMTNWCIQISEVTLRLRQLTLHLNWAHGHPRVPSKPVLHPGLFYHFLHLCTNSSGSFHEGTDIKHKIK